MAGLIKNGMAAPGMQPQEDPNEAQEDPNEEASETPEQEAAEEQQEPAEQQGDQGDGQSSEEEKDPAFQQALKFAMDALYKGGAAKQIAQQLKQAGDLPGTLADATYNIVSIVDEKTQGSVPDELLVLFASNVLEEVADIAESAGIEVKPADVAIAMKTMILRYLGENGVDTTQLQQAMDQIDPEEFNKAAAGKSSAQPQE